MPKRRKSQKAIVITGIPEARNGPNVRQSESEHDREAVAEILSLIGLPGVEPVDLHRMKIGRGIPPHLPRKMKVHVGSHGLQKQIIDLKYRLSRSEKWKGVYIRASMPLNKRKAETLLRKQIHAKNVAENGENFKDKLGDATIKFGFQMLKDGPKAVRFERPSSDQSWPARGTILSETDLPEVSLN